MRGRERLFEFENCLRTRVGIVAFADQAEHLGDVRLIGGADRIELGIGFHIIIAVGQRDAALTDVDDIDVGRLFILIDEEAD